MILGWIFLVVLVVYLVGIIPTQFRLAKKYENEQGHSIFLTREDGGASLMKVVMGGFFWPFLFLKR